MNVEPMIKARFKQFRENFELEAMQESEAFERFVNHAILSNHQPDAFGSDPELLDQICVGGGDDMGLDGIGIKVNGVFIRGKEDIQDIAEKFRRLRVEFIFIQSKFKPQFDSGEFVKFSSGVRDFLSQEHIQPRNDKVSEILSSKDFLLSDDIVVTWDSNPSVRLYYVAMGKWRDSPHLLAHAEMLKRDVLNLSTYGECQVHFIDAEALKTICDNNENTFSATIGTIDTMPLTEAEGVENSCIALCYASEFLNLLSTEEGMIRKSLFDDNVRDYQGLNSINEEIAATISNDPEKFGLLNNGITIVCDEYTPSNRRITLKNPQIVNGCQTSHVLFYARENGKPVDKVPVQIKIISTKNLDVTNQIVRGANRQNIVLDEAFEATKRFHKELEEFFNAVSQEYGRVYYERRSRQYQHDPRIRQTDKVNLRTLTQYIIGMFLNQPHLAHRHESKLLQDFESRVYLVHQSKLPYFTVALAFIRTENLFRADKLNKRSHHSFRPHLLMILREIVGGAVPSLNNEKEIDKYCEKILKVIANEKSLEQFLNQSISIFEKASDYWVNDLKKSADGRKDIEDFSKVLLTHCQKSDAKPVVAQPSDDRNFGEVIKVIVDRNGKKCGFIKRTSGDVFFHSSQNVSLSFDELEGKYVAYRITNNEKNNRPLAVEVKRIEQSEQ